MPSIVEEIKKIYLMEPIEESQSQRLPKHIRKFCRGLKIVQQKQVRDLKEANEVALKEALGKGMISHRNLFSFFSGTNTCVGEQKSVFNWRNTTK